ncbi:hypothetical protein DY000_02014281 [Brassica cretica]|uniref:Uncharacterized protein n=1 Tax=Brassica cretica TaxID=69181 RepID=A0ABQ7D1M2_BRACR|nr:hypothetical protein DY000_02014281 [Brassica cretica]
MPCCSDISLSELTLEYGLRSLRLWSDGTALPNLGRRSGRRSCSCLIVGRWFDLCLERFGGVTPPPSIDRRQPPSIDIRPPPSIDRQHHTSIDQHHHASIDNNPPRPHMMKSQPDFNTREEIDQLVEAIQGELVEIQSYIARRPEASQSIDRRNNKSIDIHNQTSIDSDTNRGRLVPKMTSDMSSTHYHGEEISADTYAALTKHKFNLESLDERLQRIENTTATMKDKWRRGDEAMRDFTDTTKDTKVDQPVNYPLLLRLF